MRIFLLLPVIQGERSETRDPESPAFLDPGQPPRGFRDDGKADMRNYHRARILAGASSFACPENKEGGAGRRRLAGLHGLMCESGRSTSEVFTAVAGLTQHPARSV
jgi:hypothetical protein